MVEDIIYDSLIFVYETPQETSGGTISSYSFDGDNFDGGGSGGETSVIFIN